MHIHATSIGDHAYTLCALFSLANNIGPQRGLFLRARAELQNYPPAERTDKNPQDERRVSTPPPVQREKPRYEGKHSTRKNPLAGTATPPQPSAPPLWPDRSGNHFPAPTAHLNLASWPSGPCGPTPNGTAAGLGGWEKSPSLFWDRS